MKVLKAVSGPRDCTIVEAMLHVANCEYEYKKAHRVFEDKARTHQERVSALLRMMKARELADAWKEVREDIWNKGGYDVHCKNKTGQRMDRHIV